MSQFKVGCSPLTSRIYAGKVLKNGTWGANKKDVTDSAVSAVAQQLLQTNEKLKFTYQGEQYELKVEKVMPQDTDGCGNDRSKCSCKNWGGCPVD